MPENKPKWIPTINLVTVWRFVRRYILRRKVAEKRNFGLIPDKTDTRDRLYKARFLADQLPDRTNLKNLSIFPYRWDQGMIGSCVGNAVTGVFVMALVTNNQNIYEPSRLFAYYNARADENKNEDTGASIRDGIKGIVKYGLCHEEHWPYNISKFHVKPSENAYTEAEKHQALIYERIYPVTKEKIMDAVYRGYGVVYGKRLFESFMKPAVAETGIVPYPKKWCEDEVGGHAMWIVDYEPDYAIEVNSWGVDWGFNGACRVPWNYILNNEFCFDFWVVYQSEGDYNLKTKNKKK